MQENVTLPIPWVSGPSGTLPRSLGPHRLTIEPPPRYTGAMVNVTNRCTLACKHCFVFREANPNRPQRDMPAERMLAEIERLRDRHGIERMTWMGGEPMMRWRMIEKGVRLFADNTVVTNGTLPLRDFGPTVIYVISLDGPKEVNDPVRGEGVFDRVMKTLSDVPNGFGSKVMVQCVLHRGNQRHADEFVRILRSTRADGVSFSFYVPSAGEVSSRAWESVEEREAAVDIVWDVKRRYGGFIWNSGRMLDLLRPTTARLVTDNCLLLKTTLPLYLEGNRFVTPFCCYGNDVDCNRCGAWRLFATAAKTPGPWDAVLPPSLS
jgi:hypothetical protein